MRHGSLLRSTAVVSLCTALSRVLGFVREILMAVVFGTTLAKSAFDVAFRIPNLFRRLFGEGALSSAFVPVFTESIERDGLEDAGRMAGSMMTLLAATLAALVTAGIVIITGVLELVPLGDKAAAVLPLLRIMLPYTFFICLVAFCMAVLNSFHHFAVPAFTPVLLNTVWIAALVFACPHFGDTPSEQILGVAWGIVAAGSLQLLVQAPALVRYGLRPAISFRWNDKRVTRVLLLMGPAALGMGILQVNVCIDGLLALWVAEWAPAALTYAERLIYLPLGVFATALGTVLLPTFSRQVTRGREDEIPATLGLSLSGILAVVVPAAVGLVILARPVVELAFLWPGGKFNAFSTIHTTRALWFYAAGLPVFSIYKVLVPVFYAFKDTRTPVRVGIPMVGLNFLLNVVFILTWPAGYKHAGLACATVVSSAANCLTLACILSRRVGSPGWGRVAGRLARIMSASAVMGVGVFLVYPRLAEALAHTGLWIKAQQFLAVGGSILVGAALYVAMAALLCRDDVGNLVRLLRSRSSDYH